METPRQASRAIPTPTCTTGGSGLRDRGQDVVRLERDPRFVDRTSRRLTHGPEAVAHARRIARSMLSTWQIGDDAAHSVLLVVSELVTNAVEHARPPLTLHLSRENTGRRVWVGITDGGPATREGAWASSCAHDEHGRGLAIVEALATTHGARHHTGGSTHWARLPLAHGTR